MKHGFDTDDSGYAVGALCTYAVYRSRDVKRFKIDKQVWDRIERFVKSSAKRASDIPEFIERLKPRLCCGSISPRYCGSDIDPTSTATVERDEDGSMTGIIVRAEDDRREFLVKVIEQADAKDVLNKALNHTCMVIALVRDRLEREKAARGDA